MFFVVRFNIYPEYFFPTPNTSISGYKTHLTVDAAWIARIARIVHTCR